jgi:hypothetical protein
VASRDFQRTIRRYTSEDRRTLHLSFPYLINNAVSTAEIIYLNMKFIITWIVRRDVERFDSVCEQSQREVRYLRMVSVDYDIDSIRTSVEMIWSDRIAVWTFIWRVPAKGLTCAIRGRGESLLKNRDHKHNGTGQNRWRDSLPPLSLFYLLLSYLIFSAFFLGPLVIWAAEYSVPT